MPLQPVRDGLPEGVGVSDAADGVRRFYAVTPLADWGLTVLAGIPQDAVLGPARRDALRAALGLLALAVAVLWLAWRLSRRLVAPLGHLAATARAVAGGQASMRADESLPGEFHTVATEFNRMLDSRDHAERLVRRLSGFLGALSRTQRAIIHRAPRDELLREACAACVEAGQARIASAWLREGAELQAVAWAGPAEALFGPMPAHRPVHGEAGLEDTLTGRALAEGLWAISNDLLADTRAGEWRERAEAAGVRAQAVFPLRCAGEIVGVLLLHVDEVGWFDDALADLLHQLTDDLAFALDNLLRENARVQAQRQSVADHRRFKSIFEASPMAIAVHSLDDGRLLDLNPVFAQQLGRPREALIGCLPSELGLGSPIDNPLELMQLLRRDGHLADHEVRLPGPDGGERVVLFSGELVDYGGQTALLTIGHDITARRDAERALRARESQLSGIVESAMDAIITIDAEHRVVMFNRAASDLMGVPASAVLGRPLDDFVPPDLRERHRQGLARFIAEGRSQVAIGHRGALFGARANGERFPFEAAVSRQGEGAQMTMTAVIRDLTERLAAEAAREARIVAEAASQAKTEFLSRMSHELRTPLNAMLGFAQLLADDPQERLSTRQARQLALVREAGWHLLALIDDVLDVSRIEAGQLELRLEAVPLRSLIDSALSVSAGLAARHQVQLLPPPPTLPASLAVRADATRLRQVVLNLLSNGCKYNRPGGTVAVEVHENGEAGNLRIDVVDSGVGMRPEQVAHLFEPFNRLGREDGPVEGTGLGLHLTRQLVSMMGGSISAHSVQGEGTRMCVRLPRATGVPAALALPAPPPDRGGAWPPHDVLLSGSVLYVEDNPVNLLLVEQFMLRWPDVRLASASNGSAGLERLRSERFDLVLLDMQLPDMHGTEVLHSLRAERLQAGTPVVALSASAMPQAVEAALAAGAAEYWTKPLDLSRLAADLQRFLRP
jgi:PAS domain S-box-containing protein